MDEVLDLSHSKFSRRQKRYIAYGAIGAAAGFFAYKAYSSDALTAVVELRKRLNRGLEGYSNSFVLASECTSKVLQDLQLFLTSDSDEIPQSLRQLAKLAKSKDIAEATSLLASSAVRGGLEHLSVQRPGVPNETAAQPSQDVLERIFNALTTEGGTNLVTLAVQMACRSSIKALYEFGPTSTSSQRPSWWQQILEFGTTQRGEKLYSACVATFVREGTKVYMGSMEGVNAWDDFVGSICKADRQVAIERLTRTFVNELIVSYLRRSRYSVKCDSKSARAAATKAGMAIRHPPNHCLAPEASEAGFLVSIQPREAIQKRSAEDLVQPEDVQLATSSTPEWASALIEASKHPEIRQLILAVAGTATAEGVRTCFSATRETLFGPQVNAVFQPLKRPVGVQQLSTRSLGTMVLFVFLPIITFLATRRASLA